ncbi:hypothetical protein DSC45_20285 [Streptomyces sp. YIM 130001]|uniref:maleylpyruvate isomerase family mycothiol-dependent enzyme n=1 Tax=Streptomyces sp. YIM 130001 TaxID=2259644 RepID=UPI000E64BD14|nr:maleylpyruvate isomerase family mycothiol-dependent enzyme [Streptomyces sp. YIM 130001]RII14694.1 hypothetical protein DSC45_20285 [Streptomyces sp. YIM 130001]
MDPSRLLACLNADFARLRSVVPDRLSARVPTCPDWTVGDLTRHVGDVYLHKTLAMREGVEREPWPPAELADEDPLKLLDRGHAGLMEEFAAHGPEDHAGSWYTPDPTVGFWIRRMAQETVIHRIDAELGAGVPVAPVAEDLAVDGIDEVLRVFAEFSVAEWGDYFTGILDRSPGRLHTLRTDGAEWRVRTAPGLFAVEGGTDGPGGRAECDVTVSAPPADLLRWLWNRESPGVPSDVRVAGTPEAVAELRGCLTVATE